MSAAQRREQLIALAERYRTPTFHFVREFVALGGLASYGTGFSDAVRAVGVYVGRILKGAKPADLPVLEPTKVRAGDQPQDGEGVGPDDPAIAVAARGRGHSVIHRRALVRFAAMRPFA